MSAVSSLLESVLLLAIVVVLGRLKRRAKEAEEERKKQVAKQSFQFSCSTTDSCFEIKATSSPFSREFLSMIDFHIISFATALAWLLRLLLCIVQYSSIVRCKYEVEEAARRRRGRRRGRGGRGRGTIQGWVEGWVEGLTRSERHPTSLLHGRICKRLFLRF